MLTLRLCSYFVALASICTASAVRADDAIIDVTVINDAVKQIRAEHAKTEELLKKAELIPTSLAKATELEVRREKERLHLQDATQKFLSAAQASPTDDAQFARLENDLLDAAQKYRDTTLVISSLEHGNREIRDAISNQITERKADYGDQDPVRTQLERIKKELDKIVKPEPALEVQVELAPAGEPVTTADATEPDATDGAAHLGAASDDLQLAFALTEGLPPLAEELPPPTKDNQLQRIPTALDAFARLPLVEKLTAAETVADFVPAGAAEESMVELIDYRFDEPARFPRYEFGLSGDRMETEGATIYEGMRLFISADGHYRLRFLVGTPNVPVTMRLQFRLIGHCDDKTVQIGTITVPPITIPVPQEPEHYSLEQRVHPVYGSTYRVHWEGFVPLDQVCRIAHAERVGSARFGFGVNVP